MFEPATSLERPESSREDQRKARATAGTAPGVEGRRAGRAIRRWPGVDITDNNIADALILAAIGCRVLGLSIDSVPPSHYIAKKSGNWIERLSA